jgi:hypothetical protein
MFLQTIPRSVQAINQSIRVCSLPTQPPTRWPYFPCCSTSNPANKMSCPFMYQKHYSFIYFVKETAFFLKYDPHLPGRPPWVNSFARGPGTWYKGKRTFVRQSLSLPLSRNSPGNLTVICNKKYLTWNFKQGKHKQHYYYLLHFTTGGAWRHDNLNMLTLIFIFRQLLGPLYTLRSC